MHIYERFSFIRKVEALTKEKSESERLKMEVEAAYRTLQYKHDQESEALRVSEALHSQLKEQITRSEEKLAKYVKVKKKKFQCCHDFPNLGNVIIICHHCGIVNRKQSENVHSSPTFFRLLTLSTLFRFSQLENRKRSDWPKCSVFLRLFVNTRSTLETIKECLFLPFYGSGDNSRDQRK